MGRIKIILQKMGGIVINRVVLVGRLTKDPEARTTPSGVTVCNFTVACDRPYVKQGEERQADFINCIAWRQTGEFVSKYFVKGNRIALDGSIQTRSWDDKNGNKRYATEVVVDHADFAQSKNDGQAAVQTAAQTAPSEPTGDIDGFMPIEDDLLPF